jgi:orotate phosphoribosyltransferase
MTIYSNGDNQIAELLIQVPGTVNFNINNPIEVKPNVFTPIYINLRNTISNVMVRNIISQKLALSIKSNPDYICGVESGGSYYASRVSDILNKPLILLRKEDKSYGDKKRILGQIPDPGSRVAIIDDVIATGLTTAKSTEYLNKLKLNTQVYAVFSYGYNKEIANILGKHTLSITSLVTFSDVLKCLEEREILPQKDIEFLKKYTRSYEEFSNEQEVKIN